MQVIVDKGGIVVNAVKMREMAFLGLANSLFRMTMTENVKFCKGRDGKQITLSNLNRRKRVLMRSLAPVLP